MAEVSPGTDRRDVARRYDEFAVEVSFDADRAVVRVRGEIDSFTAPTLAEVLGALGQLGHPDIVLDVADLSFIGGSGLTVIADTAARLRGVGGVLILRSAPAHTRRILDLTGVSDLVGFEPHDLDAVLAMDLASTASTMARNAIIDGALGLLVELAAGTVDGADGASVSLERDGRIMTVAASNGTVLEMDGHQYDTGEGPCLTAATAGHHVYSESLAEEQRWPQFVPRAQSEGVASILSTPLRATDGSVGALNIYSNTERAFGERSQDLATLFAAQATGIVADLDGEDAQLRARMPLALMARDITAEARGVLMARHHVASEGAAAMLYRAARAAGIPVLQHASEVVASTEIAPECA